MMVPSRLCALDFLAGAMAEAGEATINPSATPNTTSTLNLPFLLSKPVHGEP